MDRIWNSSNNDISVRRFSNAINLRVGQKVYGKIINMSENKEAIIRLLNGTELYAEIEGLVGEFENILMNFKVEGLKDGKLQLKLLQNLKHGKEEAQTDLLKFIAKEGMSKSDMPMLEGMLKYNIPLTNENISEVKGLLQFAEKVKANPEEQNNFIHNYLNSKGIEASSTKGVDITNKLLQFISNFKDMSMDEILLFLESNIDFSSESIDSYGKLFKGDESIFNIVQDLGEGLDKLDSVAPKGIVEVILDFEDQILPKEIVASSKNKPEITKELTAILRENSFAINSKSAEVLYNIIDKAIEETVKKNISLKSEFETNHNQNTNDRIYSKAMLEEKLSEVIGQKIAVSDEKFQRICEMLDLKPSIEGNTKEKSTIESSVLTKDAIKEIIANKESASKEVLNKVISLLASEGDSEEGAALMQLIKSSINEVKLFNKFSDNYYFLNIPINFKEKEYPCKLIIKDDRKDGKKLDSKNLKLALNINTGNLGTINSFVKVSNKNINIELQCEKTFMKVFEITKHKLKERIEDLGFNVNIIVTKAKEEFSLTSCRSFFGDNNVAGIDITV